MRSYFKTRNHHIPRDEATERFIDNSIAYKDDKFISHADENNFYLNLLEFGATDWDLWTVTHYSDAVGVIRWIKKSGYKVKVINKGNRVIILYKNC